MSMAKLMLYFAQTYKVRVLKGSNPLPTKELYQCHNNLTRFRFYLVAFRQLYSYSVPGKIQDIMAFGLRFKSRKKMLGAQLCFHSCSERVGKELGDKISLEMRNTWNILASLTIPHIFLMLGVKNALFALFMLTQISKLRLLYSRRNNLSSPSLSKNYLDFNTSGSQKWELTISF